jgi:integrase
LVDDISPAAPVFANLAGGRIRPDTVSARWISLCNNFGMRQVRLHDARHTVASMLLTAGQPVHQVSALLGHSSPVVTHATYSHLIDGSDEAVATAIGDLLDGNDKTDEADAGILG